MANYQKQKNIQYDQKKLIIEFDAVLGLNLNKIKPFKIPPAINDLIKQREISRTNKQFIQADALRKEIEKLGYVIEDTDSGPKAKKIMNIKLPPQDIEAERSVLGALMLDKNAVIRVADLITARDFYSNSHIKIFETILELFEKNEPIDILSVTSRLKNKGLLAEIGGSSYLTELINSVPTASHIAHYAKIIRNKKVLRDLIAASSEINEKVFDNPEDSENLLDEIEQKIFPSLRNQFPKILFSLKTNLKTPTNG